MGFLINGKLVDDLDECDLRKLSLTHELPATEAVLLAPEEALRRSANAMKWGFGIIYIVIAGLLIFLATVATPVTAALDLYARSRRPPRARGRYAARVSGEHPQVS